MILRVIKRRAPKSYVPSSSECIATYREQITDAE
jgi:hypothetical protein